MKKMFTATVALAMLAVFISSAEAVKIRLADVQNGVAVVKGGKAAANATITWEGANVAKANRNGVFSFSGSVPSDCVGTLSDGVTTVEVALTSCTPVSEGEEEVEEPGATALAPVPQTGQVSSFDPNTPQRDDGALRKGVALPSPRFTDNSNGTITDNLTGLIWLKNANCPMIAKTWQEALDNVTSLNSDGTMAGPPVPPTKTDCGDTSNAGSHQTDWCLPNIRELFSLVDFAFLGPAISNAAGTGRGSDSDPFSTFQTVSFYWSSTTDAFFSDSAWVVNFETGGVSLDTKNTNWFVLAVRGGS